MEIMERLRSSWEWCVWKVGIFANTCLACLRSLPLGIIDEEPGVKWEVDLSGTGPYYRLRNSSSLYGVGSDISENVEMYDIELGYAAPAAREIPLDLPVPAPQQFTRNFHGHRMDNTMGKFIFPYLLSSLSPL
jgi:hypothetical protein